jgi:exosortase A-associated hydrolase 2
LKNVGTGIDWLKGRHAGPIYLWGLRSGVLLAMDYASRGQYRIERLIAWQPVLNGDTFITQFLRLRVAAAMLDNDAPQEKASDLKRQLLEGQFIEVAGYLLNPDLIKPLLSLRADRVIWQAAREVVIAEVVPSVDSAVSIGNSQWLDRLLEQNICASLTKVVGDAFWANQGSSGVPDLIKITGEKTAHWL